MKLALNIFAYCLSAGISSTSASAYVLNEQCFSNSRIESVSTFPDGDAPTKTREYVQVGVDLESRGSTGAIVYVKVKPESVFGSIINIAASRGEKINACFDQPLAKELKDALKNNKKTPRYEHQKVVEFLDVGIVWLGKKK